MSDDLPESDNRTSEDGLAARIGTDRAAFAALYDRYYPRVLKYCLRRLFDRDTAEDVTSEVFLSVASHVRGFTGRTETDFRRWVFRIATNAVNAHLRKSLRRKTLWNMEARNAHLIQHAEFHLSSVEQPALDWPVVYQALLGLEERDQSIIALRFFAELSHEEISDVVQMAPGAVRTALSRALQRLREKLEPSSRPENFPGKSLQG